MFDDTRLSINDQDIFVAMYHRLKKKIQVFCLISTKNIDLKKFLREAVFYIACESLCHFHFIFKNTEMKNLYISWLTLVLTLSIISRRINDILEEW